MALLLQLGRIRTALTLSTPKPMLNALGQQDFSVSSSKSNLSTTLPKKPKRPSSSYIRFVVDNRGSIVPPADTKEPHRYVVQQLAERWRNASDDVKNRYQAIYESEKKEYVKNMVKYENSLTPEHRALILQQRKEKKEADEKRDLKKKRRELGKPKKPTNAFMLFLNDQAKKTPTASALELSAKCSSLWEKLSESEKKPYIKMFDAASEKYKKDLAKWEEKMVKEGHLDVLPKRLSEPKPKTVRAKAPTTPKASVSNDKK